MKVEPLIIGMRNVVVKSSVDKGRRLIEVDASSEDKDSENDIILQSALMNSAESFIKSGHIDIDHLSELGARMGIHDPNSYIIGRPVDVQAKANGHTHVVAEIMQSPDGVFNPSRHRYDDFWESLHRQPPVQWSSSIYGFPIDGMVDDHGGCGDTRFVIKGIDWRSLAMTRNPINRNLKGFARIVSAKSWIGALVKSGAVSLSQMGAEEPDGGDQMVGEPDIVLRPDKMPGNPDVQNDPHQAITATAMAEMYARKKSAMMPGIDVPELVESMLPPRNLDDAVGQYHRHMLKACSHTGGFNSTVGFRDHFVKCCGMHPEMADVWAHALMHHVARSRLR